MPARSADAGGGEMAAGCFGLILGDGGGLVDAGFDGASGAWASRPIAHLCPVPPVPEGDEARFSVGCGVVAGEGQVCFRLRHLPSLVMREPPLGP